MVKCRWGVVDWTSYSSEEGLRALGSEGQQNKERPLLCRAWSNMYCFSKNIF